GFSATNPVRHFDFFELYLQPKLTELAGDIIDGRFGLSGTSRPGADFFGKVRQLAVGVIVVQSGGFDGGQLIEQLRRKVLLLHLGHLWDGAKYGWRGSALAI